MSTRPFDRLAVTRIELLASACCLLLVMAIIVPLGHAQRQLVSSTTCESNLGQIAQGAAQYGILYDDWIVGSPNTSGAYLVQPVQAPPPVAYGAAVQAWDFLGPLQDMWGIGDFKGLPPPLHTSAVARRFNRLRQDIPVFRCPENNFQAPHYAGPNAGTGLMVSYNTSRTQMWYQHLTNGQNGLTVDSSGARERLPADRAPRISTMGKLQNKVFCADGGRYSNSQSAPDYDLSVRGTWGGAFGDTAPYDRFSDSWDRTSANGTHIGIDARQYAFRHSIGTPPPGAPANSYRMNLAFYDGHVETQGDLDASNPQQWLPMGTVLETSDCWQDTRNYFGLGFEVTIGP